MDYSFKILGSGSAKATIERFHSAHILQMRERQFLIDCGEGAQIRLKQYAARTSRLGHIFISHLHGDHCLGLMGLLSTFGMLGRVSDLTIHAHPDIEKLFGTQIKYFCADAPYKIILAPFDPRKVETIYEDRAVAVRTLPLKHTVPTCGFLFEEKPLPRHLNKKMCDAWEVPVSQYKNLIAGDGYVTPSGEVVANNRLTFDPTPSKRFAYMSDTAYTESCIDLIKGVDLLYHEATYLSSVDVVKLKTRMHSSAAQAAEVARKAEVGKLVIGHYSSTYSDVKLFEDEARKIFKESYAGNDGDTFWF